MTAEAPAWLRPRALCRLPDGAWHADGVPLTAIAREVQTPFYVYSYAALTGAYQFLKSEFCHSNAQICYAVKTCDNIAVLRALQKQGAGFDIVSGGELQRALLAGAAPESIVFSGVGKSAEEIDAALRANIGCFNVESEGELARIEQLAAAADCAARVALRLNPDIDGETHRHLTTGTADSKFGLSLADGRRLARVADSSSHLQFLGFSCHIGSQIHDEAIYLQLADVMRDCVAATEADGIRVARVDMGGGFGVQYQGEERAEDFVAREGDAAGNKPPLSLSLRRYDQRLARYFAGREIVIEPGRSIAAAAGAIVCQVQYVKRAAGKTLWVTDAGMTTLMRPALYDAYHRIEPLAPRKNGAARRGDVVGPVCESADIVGRERDLNLDEGDYALILHTGAYGLVMANNYNARPRPAAVLTQNGRWRIIRRAETLADMLQFEVE